MNAEKRTWSSGLRRWVALPDGMTEAEQRQQVFRIVAITTMGTITTLVITLATIQDSIWRLSLSTIMVIDGAGLVGLYLNGRGRTRAASVLFLAAIFVRITYSATIAAGIRSPGMSLLLVCILMAAVLLGQRAATVAALVCATIEVFLVIAEDSGSLPPRAVVWQPVPLLVLNLAYMAIMLGLVELVIRAISRSLSRAHRELAERKRVDAERERLVGELRERVKELRLLHRAGSMLLPERPFSPALLEDLVELIPAAWMHSEVCEARIRHGDTEVATAGWRETPWMQAAGFTSAAGEGEICVAYMEARPARQEGPFLAEERSLLDSLAEMLKTHIDRDVAERNRAVMEETLRHKHKMEALGTLAGGIAHDFNNALAAIVGNAELGLAESTDPDAREMFTDIHRSSSRARDLVKRILIFSRRQQSAKSVIRLDQVVADAVHLLEASVPPRIAVRTRLSANAPPVMADPSEIHQVIINLGTNGVHAMRDSGILEIEIVRAIIEDGAAARLDLHPGVYARLRVRDSGAGIPDDVRLRMFEPFYTTKGLEGTGLGLSVVHGIVRDHAGVIEVETKAGTGSTFTIYFPAAAGEVHVAPREETLPGNRERVMYVDDDASIVQAMERVLSRLGYVPFCFSDAAQALDAFRADPSAYEALVTDLAMPGMNGVELAAAVRAIRPDCPIALTSGYTEGDRELIRAHQVAVVIPKPATVPEISRALSELLRIPVASV